MLCLLRAHAGCSLASAETSLGPSCPSANHRPQIPSLSLPQVGYISATTASALQQHPLSSRVFVGPDAFMLATDTVSTTVLLIPVPSQDQSIGMVVHYPKCTTGFYTMYRTIYSEAPPIASDPRTAAHATLLDIRAGGKRDNQTAGKEEDRADDTAYAVLLRDVVVPCGAHRHHYRIRRKGAIRADRPPPACAPVTGSAKATDVHIPTMLTMPSGLRARSFGSVTDRHGSSLHLVQQYCELIS
ncbi:hypothetical protein NUW54_g9812 [Trametes sanguinea]|uniref:Uncharacterized protein n=1 Tax=Trametes sanguinea TaxID=158606 RepID=A0ACC1P3H8_9APHY|nr:hypothetical protein NUW54_g9812 [Trametes sanguinea]